MTRGFEIASGFEDKNINLPVRKTKYSAGYDIECCEDTVVPSFKKGAIQVRKTECKKKAMYIIAIIVVIAIIIGIIVAIVN